MIHIEKFLFSIFITSFVLFSSFNCNRDYLYTFSNIHLILLLCILQLIWPAIVLS